MERQHFQFVQFLAAQLSLHGLQRFRAVQGDNLLYLLKFCHFNAGYIALY